MPYTLNIDTGVTGLENLDRLKTSMDSSARAADVMDEKLRHITGTNALLTKSLEIQKETLGLVRSQLMLMADGAERASGSVNRLSGSFRQMGDSAQHGVTQVQAVGGALRTLEGAMPIRAAERFLTLLPGIGSALQVAFPVFGAIAFAEVLGRMVGEIGKLAEKWDPVLRAQKQSLDILKAQTDEIVRQGQVSDRLRITGIARAFGQPAGARVEAQEHDLEATMADTLVAAIRSEITDAQTRIAAGTVTRIRRPPPGRRGPATQTGLNADALAAQKSLPGLMAELQLAEITAGNERTIASNIRQDAAAEENRLSAADRKVNVERAAELRRIWDEIEKSTKKAAENFDTMIGPLVLGAARFSTSTHFMDEVSNAPRITDELGPRQREAELILRQQFPELIGAGRPDIEAPAGFSTVQQQLRQMRRSAARRLGLQGVQSRFDDNTLQGQRSGVEAATAMQLAALNREEQVVQDRILDATKKEEALADIENRRYDVALQAEQKLLEIALRQKEQFEQTVIGLFEAARHHNVGGFLRGKLDQVLDQVLAQAAGVVFDKIGLGRGKPSGMSIPDVLGGAAKTATDQNTVATDDNTNALRDLTAQLRRMTGGTATSPSGGGGGWSPSWNGGSGPFVLNGFPGAGGPPLGGGGGMGGGVSIGGIPLSRIATAAVGAGAVFAGIHAGGASGDLEAAAGAVGIASTFFPPLMPVALALGVASALFGNSRQNRSNQIGNQLSAAQFMSPVSINASMSAGGTFADFDRFGNVRDSNLSPFPQIQNGYFVAQRGQTAPGQQVWVPVPGRTLNQFGGPSGGGTTTINVNAMDSKSIIDNHAAIADAVARSLNLGSSPHLSETLTSRAA